ncbi:uncharacterized protein [Solanum lycopersicum]|uniref:Mitochondrial import inner membrane translocase subunit TIM50 n=1 Tax=Solanum lycopersicum TaxID=4081 RepID=A0A3Q7HZ00_SOLLC
MASNLKLKNVVVDSNDNNSDYEDEKVAKNLDFYFSLEKLNLGPKKKLLVLNLGGLLVDRVHRRNESTVRRYTPDLSHGNFLVFKRPYCDQFMKFCLERFEVGLWSSAMDRNVEPILDNIMIGLRKKLVFVWDQDKCIDSGFSTVEKKNKPIFLKKLKKIWENNYYGSRFSESNTLLIDDEPHVALLNPPNTGVFPPAYKVKNNRDTFLDAKGEMHEFLEGLVDADDVPTYVKGHQFGQPAITNTHKDWDYYSKIIRDVEDPSFGCSDYESHYSY